MYYITYTMSGSRIRKFIHPKGSIYHEGAAWMVYGTLRVDKFPYPTSTNGIRNLSYDYNLGPLQINMIDLFHHSSIIKQSLQWFLKFLRVMKFAATSIKGCKTISTFQPPSVWSPQILPEPSNHNFWADALIDMIEVLLYISKCTFHIVQKRASIRDCS